MKIMTWHKYSNKQSEIFRDNKRFLPNSNSFSAENQSVNYCGVYFT